MLTFDSVSGEAPQVPVASRKSGIYPPFWLSGTSSDNLRVGNIFEKRLIEAYIADHGTDPVNGEELSTDDLVELKNARAVRPRPPTLTSIPALLSTFQDEWDALALETYTLKQHLAQTRQELSTALYDFDGALRVIAKITKERDEARDALSKISVQGNGAATNGGAMEVDSPELPETIVAKVEATQQRHVHLRDHIFSNTNNIQDSPQPAGNAQYPQIGQPPRLFNLSKRQRSPTLPYQAPSRLLSMRAVTWLYSGVLMGLR